MAYFDLTWSVKQSNGGVEGVGVVVEGVFTVLTLRTVT